MSQTWYDTANLSSDNWYKNKGLTNNMDIPKCISCDNFIVTSKNSDLCSKCLSFVEERNNSNVEDFVDSFSNQLISFETDHIPEFSVITAFIKGESFLTIGVDWREVLITDVVEEDFSNEIVKNNLIHEAENSLVGFVIELGDLMYPDIFDYDALRAMDSDMDKIVQGVLENIHGFQKPIIAWKAIDEKEFSEWGDNGFIPKGEVFSLSKYFSFEKKSSTSKNKVLLKLFTSKDNIYIRKNNSIEVRKDLDITEDNLEIL